MGIAVRGLLIGHLVLPNDLAGSAAVIDFIAREISTDSFVNIMDQYRPTYRAVSFQSLNRPPTREEYADVVDHAIRKGLHRGFEAPSLSSRRERL